MSKHEFRCSSIGKLMTNPKSKAEGILSVGAKTYIRELAQEEIFGIDFLVSSKELEKGIEVEPDSTALLNRVRGLDLVKNEERKKNGYVTGECDLYSPTMRRGFDLKSSWSAKTFPGWPVDCYDSLYEWQMRGYMWLWDADTWEVNWCLVDTPERLIRGEPLGMHVVSHIPEHMRLSTWLLERDFAKEREMKERIEAAQEHFDLCIKEFDSFHPKTFAK